MKHIHQFDHGLYHEALERQIGGSLPVFTGYRQRGRQSDVNSVNRLLETLSRASQIATDMSNMDSVRGLKMPE